MNSFFGSFELQIVQLVNQDLWFASSLEISPLQWLFPWPNG